MPGGTPGYQTRRAHGPASCPGSREARKEDAMTQLPPAGLPEPGHRYAARNLCDGCLWEVTGTPASCQDG